MKNINHYYSFTFHRLISLQLFYSEYAITVSQMELKCINKKHHMIEFIVHHWKLQDLLLQFKNFNGNSTRCGLIIYLLVDMIEDACWEQEECYYSNGHEALI